MLYNSDANEKRSTYVLEENDCNLKNQQKYETVMCLGNGYLGMRGSFSESNSAQSRLTLIAGLYDQQPNEVEELMMLPDTTLLSISADGNTVSPMSAYASDYSRSLNLKNGLMTYSYRYTPEGADAALAVTQRRFASMDQRHFVGFETVIKPEYDTQLSICASVDARQTMSGTQHIFEEDRVVLEDDVLWYAGKAAVAGTPFRVANRVKVYVNGKELTDTQRYSTVRRLLSTSAKFSVSKGDEVRILRYVLFYTGNDAEMAGMDYPAMKSYIIDEMARLAKKSFDELLAESQNAWAKRWQTCDLTIDGADPTETLNARLCMYHMIIMCPDHDDRMSIAAKGLTGPGYAGHVFWDCEIFNLPFFTYTDPATARKLCTYRHHTLGGARAKAKEYGFRGAMYPWESSSSKGDEQCPTLGNYDSDNTRRHVTCGEIEHHIVCDVAYGVYNYAKTTNDEDFMDKCGYEILFETADFWQSRLDYNAEKDRYEILQVTGPDEYKEYVDNNAYTNYLVKWNLDTALAEAERLQVEAPETFARFEKLIGLTALMQNIKDKAHKIYLPVANEDGLVPQNDTYLGLRQIDLTKYKTSNVNRLIYKDYTTEEKQKIMVSKQADLIQLCVLMPDLFPADIVRKNFDFYEDKCLHDSSLSLSAFAMVATKLGESDFAHKFFTDALNTDFGYNKINCHSGIHAANCGGVWQTIVFGFAGVSATGDALNITPALPSCWNELSFHFYWNGCSMKITVNKTDVTVESLNGKEVELSVCGNKVSLKDSVTVSYKA